MHSRITHISTATMLLEIGSIRLLTDPVFDPLCLGSFRIAPSHFLLHLYRTAHGIYDAGELDEQAVASGLH